jgi:hypothetical protein
LPVFLPEVFSGHGVPHSAIGAGKASIPRNVPSIAIDRARSCRLCSIKPWLSSSVSVLHQKGSFHVPDKAKSINLSDFPNRRSCRACLFSRAMVCFLVSVAERAKFPLETESQKVRKVTL